MDLLSDIGMNDQLTATRAENAALHDKVKELTAALKEVKLENTILKAEVEVYKREAEKASESLDIVKRVSMKGNLIVDEEDHFMKMGNGMYCKEAAVTLEEIHGTSNPLSCALNSDDTLLATGGADMYLRLFSWGMALAPYDTAIEETMNKSRKILLSSPVICADFSHNSRSGSGLLATGGMDGTVNIVRYSDIDEMQILQSNIKHGKYVKSLHWSPTKYGHTSILASAAADGTLFLSKVDEDTSHVYTMEQLRFDGPVEALCFLDHGSILCVHARGTTYISYFYIDQELKQKKFTLNASANDDHVSFTVLSLVPSPCEKYIAAATDASRNIILDAKTCRQVRNLYGHVNDGYSTPKIGWSSNGQYLYGNTQNEAYICVWDISSSSIVNRMVGHNGQIRDLYSSSLSDTLVTISYDKTAKIWLIPFE